MFSTALPQSWWNTWKAHAPEQEPSWREQRPWFFWWKCKDIPSKIPGEPSCAGKVMFSSALIMFVIVRNVPLFFIGVSSTQRCFKCMDYLTLIANWSRHGCTVAVMVILFSKCISLFVWEWSYSPWASRKQHTTTMTKVTCYCWFLHVSLAIIDPHNMWNFSQLSQLN